MCLQKTKRRTPSAASSAKIIFNTGLSLGQGSAIQIRDSKNERQKQLSETQAYKHVRNVIVTSHKKVKELQKINHDRRQASVSGQKIARTSQLASDILKNSNTSRSRGTLNFLTFQMFEIAEEQSQELKSASHWMETNERQLLSFSSFQSKPSTSHIAALDDEMAKVEIATFQNEEDDLPNAPRAANNLIKFQKINQIAPKVKTMMAKH